VQSVGAETKGFALGVGFAPLLVLRAEKVNRRSSLDTYDTRLQKRWRSSTPRQADEIIIIIAFFREA
jgi:hypothetical protein